MWPLFSFMFSNEAPGSSQQLPTNVARDAQEHDDTDMDMPIFDSGSEADCTEEADRESTASPSAFANFRRYVLKAELPPLELGMSAPPNVPRGHRTHLNKLAVIHDAHRVRFQIIIPAKDFRHFRFSAIKFSLARIPVSVDENDLPNTGYELTMSTDYPPILIKPNSLLELNSLFLTTPFQTLTRVMHIAFPELCEWDITIVPYALQFPPSERTWVSPDPDGEIWTTYVWRRIPPPADIETYYRKDLEIDVLGKCRVVFVVQPPWVLSEADVDKFLKTKSLRVYNEYEPEYYPPYDSGERIWAKLWDVCVRHRCHHWVLTSYHDWVFGAFSEGFGGGRILCRVRWNDNNPSPLRCLVYHVAAAMGMVTSILPDAPEDMENVFNLPTNQIPPSVRTVDMEYPDSDSDWEGMDEDAEFPDAPIPSLSISNYGGARAREPPLSATRIVWPSNTIIVSRMSRGRTDMIFDWSAKVCNLQDPTMIEPPGRSPSPVPSEGAVSTLSILEAAYIDQEDIPEITEVTWGQHIGTVLATVEEDREPDCEWDGVIPI